ncbi:ABC-three component system middle component 2 [Rhodomicrobium vannielii]|nr:ABC-three component system middle component 2 [Rhodomicrobium vannielii]
MIDHARLARPFNSPLECGLRLLFVLAAAEGTSLDLQRLIFYDYLLVHSGDVPGGPVSLHPPVPHRSTELLIRRDLVQLGLNEMFARELIQKTLDARGINYHSTKLTSAFLMLMQTAYADGLRVRSSWLISEFHHYDDSDLQAYMSKNIPNWGAEFDNLTAINALEL